MADDVSKIKYFSPETSPSNSSLNEAVKLKIEKRHCASLGMTLVSAGAAVPSAFKNLGDFFIKFFVATFATTLGQIPSIKEKTWSSLEEKGLVSSNLLKTWGIVAKHIANFVLFLTFSVGCCLTVGFISIGACKRAHDALGLTSKDFFISKEIDRELKNEDLPAAQEVVNEEVVKPDPETQKDLEPKKTESPRRPLPVPPKTSSSLIPPPPPMPKVESQETPKEGLNEKALRSISLRPVETPALSDSVSQQKLAFNLQLLERTKIELEEKEALEAQEKEKRRLARLSTGSVSIEGDTFEYHSSEEEDLDIVFPEDEEKQNLTKDSSSYQSQAKTQTISNVSTNTHTSKSIEELKNPLLKVLRESFKEKRMDITMSATPAKVRTPLSKNLFRQSDEDSDSEENSEENSSIKIKDIAKSNAPLDTNQGSSHKTESDDKKDDSITEVKNPAHGKKTPPAHKKQGGGKKRRRRR